jgi:hypothetical protein
MFHTSDTATAQPKLLLGPDRCLRLEPQGENASIEMDDYDKALLQLPGLAYQDFEKNRSSISPFFENPVNERERHYSVDLL